MPELPPREYVTNVSFYPPSMALPTTGAASSRLMPCGMLRLLHAVPGNIVVLYLFGLAILDIIQSLDLKDWIVVNTLYNLRLAAFGMTAGMWFIAALLALYRNANGFPCAETDFTEGRRGASYGRRGARPGARGGAHLPPCPPEDSLQVGRWWHFTNFLTGFFFVVMVVAAFAFGAAFVLRRTSEYDPATLTTWLGGSTPGAYTTPINSTNFTIFIGWNIFELTLYLVAVAAWINHLRWISVNDDGQ